MDYIGRALVADALSEWRDQLRHLATMSPLRDLSLATAPIDLTGGHPSGLAPLFAGRPTLLSSIVRDPMAREAALARGRAVREAVDAARRNTGINTGALVVGHAAWTESGERREMPVLLRPVTFDEAREQDTQVRLHPEARLNPVFAAEARERAPDADLERLARESLGDQGFDPRPLWNAVRGLGGLFGEDFEVVESLLLGSFDDPEQRLVDDLDECDHLIASSLLLASVAGDREAHQVLTSPLPEVGVGDRDPFAERGLGDLDDVQFAALDMVASGRNVFIQVPPGADAVATAAAVAADGAASGRTVAVVTGTAATAEAVAAALDAAGAGDLYINGASPTWNTEARQRLLASITMDLPSVDEASLRARGEGLLAARAALRQRYDDLHREYLPWGTSAYRAVQELVRLTSGEHAPTTTVRLGPAAADHVVDRGIDVVAAAGARALADRLGLESARAEPPPPPAPEEAARRWWADIVPDPQRGAELDDALAAFLHRHLPRLRAQALDAYRDVGVDPAGSLAAWEQQVRLFEDLRSTLDTISPAVFQAPLGDMVAATAPAGASPDRPELPRRERRSLARQAEGFLRPGRDGVDLHSLLRECQDRARRWRTHCGAGGWPRVPDHVDEFAARLAEAAFAWGGLAPTLAAATGESELASLPWDDLAAILERLTDAPRAPLEEAAVSEAEAILLTAGFGPLLDDLAERGVPVERAADEFEFAWWASALEAILVAQPQLAAYGEIGAAVDDFLARDAAFAASRSGPLMRAVGERRRSAISVNPEAARDIFAQLVEGGDGPYRELWAHAPSLVGALRPVVIAAAEQVSHLAPAQRALHTVVLVGVESLTFAQVVPALARATQAVVLADAHAATRSAVQQLRAALPAFSLQGSPQPRDPRVTAVLAEHGYGRELPMLPSPGRGGSLELFTVAPAGATAAESTRAEVAAVAERVGRARDSRPQARAAVVAGNDLHAARVREALDERLGADSAAVPVVTWGSAAGIDADVVLVSPGHAASVDGALPRSLGLLSTPVGASALRQALVASRRDVVVVTALGMDQLAALAASADAGHGVDALADLVAVAQADPIRPAESPMGDPLLADLARRLRQEGLRVAVRCSVGGEAIPMVVGPPEGPFTVAVVTDGTPPAVSVSLRDHVRRQRGALAALGWRVVPLWTVDMFVDPAAAARQVLAEFPGVGRPQPPAPEADTAVAVEAPPGPPAEQTGEPARADTEPLLPSRAQDDMDRGWGDDRPVSREEELRREVPPHW